MPISELKELIKKDPLARSYVKSTIIWEDNMIYSLDKECRENTEIEGIYQDWNADKISTKNAEAKLESLLPFKPSDFELVSNNLDYVNSEPMRVVIFTYKGQPHRICLWHSSWGDGEEFDGSQLEVGTFVPKTMMEFVPNEV